MIVGVRGLGINAPILYDVNLKDAYIIMEYIDGVRMKDMLNDREVSIDEKRTLCFNVGQYIGMMHANGYIHGDLTTSNIIIRNNKPYFIDFSLGTKSNSIEDMGVDLRAFEEAFGSTHPDFEEGWELIIDGYLHIHKEGLDVLDKVGEIKRRGRYVT